MIDIIGSRETKDVVKVIKSYKNLKVISRDRGNQYKNIQGPYTHIADRFHLIKNLSDAIISNIKKELPNSIKLDNNNLCSSSNKKQDLKLSIADKNRINLIKGIKIAYEKCKNLSELGRIFSLDRRTIRKYIDMESPNDEGVFKKNNKSSKLAKYQNVIFEYYKSGSKITDIKNILLS